MSEPTMAEQLEQERLERVADPADGIIDDAAIIAARNGWPYVRCGDPCGFTATAPDGDLVDTMLLRHQCGQPGPEPVRPDFRRLVVGCVTFIAMLIIVGLLIEDLAGVK